MDSEGSFFPEFDGMGNEYESGPMGRSWNRFSQET